MQAVYITLRSRSLAGRLRHDLARKIIERELAEGETHAYQNMQAGRYEKAIEYLEQSLAIALCGRIGQNLPDLKMAKVVEVDGYVGFDKIFMAIYVIGRAKSVTTQFERTAGI